MKRIKVSFEIWIQLLGMVGVLGGLVFVGLEMQQTQSIALVNQIQERSYKAIDTVNATIEADLDWFSAAFAIASPVEGLTSQEKARRSFYNINWFMYEADYFSIFSRFNDRCSLAIQIKSDGSYFAEVFVPEIYDSRIALVEEGFRIIIESLSSDECEVE